MKAFHSLFQTFFSFKSMIGLLFTLCLLAPSCQASWYLDHYEYNGYRAGRIINIDTAAYPPVNSDDPSSGQLDPHFVGEKAASDGRLELGISGSATVRGTNSRSFLTELFVNVTPVYKWAGGGTPSTEFWVRERGHISVFKAHWIGGTSNPHNPYSQQSPYQGQYVSIEKASDGFDDLDKKPGLMDGTKKDGDRAYGTHKNFYNGTTGDDLWSNWHVRSGDWGYLPGGWRLFKRTVPAGATEVPGESRTLFATVRLSSLWSTSQTNSLTASLTAIYEAEVCQFSLGVSSDIIGDSSKHPRNKKLTAYATRNHTNRYQTELPSVFFWDGNANYSADISNNLLSTLRTPTDGTLNPVTPQYTWSTRTSGQYNGVSSPIVPPQELGSYYPPTPDDIAKGTVEPSTQEKYFHHNVGTKDGTKWTWPQSTRTRVIVSGSQGTGNLTAKAQIEWWPQPLTHFRSETHLEVIDLDTGAVTPFIAETIDDEQAQIDAYIADIEASKDETFETGKALVHAALEGELLVGSWFVPDAVDAATVVGSKLFKAVKVARVVERVLRTVNKVGGNSLAAIKRSRVARGLSENVILRARTIVIKEHKMGKMPPNGRHADEELTGVIKKESQFFGQFCFVAGTPVVLADGSLKPIEQIQTGDFVLSKDESSGEVAAKRVAQTFERQAPTTLALTFSSGEVIETTAEHPFYVEHKGFVPAGLLAIGNSIVTRAGPSLSITGIEKKNAPQRVYNFTVEEFHSYFVGKSNLWAHNADYTKRTRQETFHTGDIDSDAEQMASDRGGLASRAFNNDSVRREFDMVSDGEIGQVKLATATYDSVFRKQAHATFQQAAATQRRVVYRFKGGSPEQSVLDALQRYAERYDVDLVIEIM